MRLRTVQSEVAVKLGIGARYPDRNAIATNILPQPKSLFFQLPFEIRQSILRELFRSAGVQHIVLRGDRYTHARCITDHVAPDDLMEECAKHDSNSFVDQVLRRRLESTWGNHWKCEELHQAKESKQISNVSFLAVLLACRQMYTESRDLLYDSLIFVVHDLDTYYNMTVARPLYVLDEIRHLQLVIRLNVREPSDRRRVPQELAGIDRWRKSCLALDQAARRLRSVEARLDSTDPGSRHLLSIHSSPQATIYNIAGRLAEIMTIDLPLEPHYLV
ncbi:hypothetical protein FALBO_9902 [Fusarium albosuccineum]|uniref:DUF7730 domain-containing protein n=1 Tax=Fusarium albosuccineum TaxID=1237068 RepID=A0A8H4P8K2_9HYPO|nr:hypothetical protein FALBO_9902 [Fusarium albosuccineum]